MIRFMFLVLLYCLTSSSYATSNGKFTLPQPQLSAAMGCDIFSGERLCFERSIVCEEERIFFLFNLKIDDIQSDIVLEVINTSMEQVSAMINNRTALHFGVDLGQLSYVDFGSLSSKDSVIVFSARSDTQVYTSFLYPINSKYGTALISEILLRDVDLEQLLSLGCFNASSLEAEMCSKE
ncbi:hypothetical protein ACP3V5_03620 [Vibrio maritimus]